MAILRKVYAEDFEKIYPLLLQFNDTRLSKEYWRRIFTKHWDGEEDYFGYALFDNNESVGFLGTFFSERVINSRKQKFCNLTCWIVKDAYRNESLLFLGPLLKLKEYTITAFTPDRATYVTLKKFGFEDIETHMRLILPLSMPEVAGGNCSVEFDRERIKGYLREDDLKVYNDHLKFNCIHLLIRVDEGNCYMLLTRARKKALYFAHIHYVNNPDIFLKYIGRLSLRVCLKLKVCGVLAEERFLSGRVPKHSASIKISKPRLFKSNLLQKNEIDNLYSELVVLGI